MRKRPVLLYSILAVIVIASLAVMLGHHLLFPQKALVSKPVHSAMEAWTTVYSLLMTLFLWQRWRRDFVGRDYKLGAGFFFMCVMDGIVAVSSTAAEMETFHTLSGLAGSLWFALVWVPPFVRRPPFGRHATWLVVVAAGLVSVGLFATGKIDPALYAWPGREDLLVTMKHVYGILFLAATARFIVDFHRTGSAEALLMAGLSLFLGLAGLMEISADAWHGEWWVWHLMRIVAFAFVLLFVVVSYREMLARLRNTVERQRKAEEALRESEKLYRLITEQSADVIWMADRNLRFVYSSPSVVRQRGFAPEEIYAMTLEESMTPESLELGMKVLQEELASEATGSPDPERTRTIEMELTCKDGSTVWTETTFRFLRDESGAYNGLLGVTRNIEERKRQEIERHALEAQLHQAQKLESIGRMAGGVAHDFNNLLAVILNYSDFAAVGLDPDDPRLEDILQIKQAGKRAAELTKQLLAFSRKEIVRPEVVRVGDVLGDVERLLKRTIGEDVELAVSARSATWNVKVDPGRLEQVLMNLVMNSRDAMPEGGKLSITAFNQALDISGAESHPDVPPGRYVVIAVRDTGCGMTPDVIERAIEPFYTTKERGKGTGLGLSSVYGIVKQAGGELVIESAPGKGTDVKVYLPATEEESTRVSTTSILPGQEGKGITVLVVEDEASVIKMVGRMLANGGYTVLEARNGQEAIEIAERHEGVIDVLLTDVVMPQMSGKEAADRLTAARPGLKVLYMSGYADDKLDEHGILDGRTWFIQKPFTAGGLLSKVREVLAE